MKTQTDKKIIKGFRGEFLHPSLDIKDAVLILGFRHMTEEREEKEIFLITKKGEVEPSEKDSFEFEGKMYFIEKEGRKIARLEEKWGFFKLNNFLKNFYEGRPLPTLKDIYNKNKELLKKYVELEQEIDYSILASWITGTYFFSIFSAYPFLHIKAPKRSGKSQCLNFLKQVCFNAIKARPSLAALGDTVDSLRGVYLIDQADSLGRKGNEDLLDILADSYKKEGGKRRIIDLDKRKGRRVLEFETYSPKVFASIKELPEDLGDRCLIIPLIRSQKNFPSPDEESEDWREIRGEFYQVLIKYYGLVGSTYLKLKTEYHINPVMVGRELELWLPLQVMFEVCAENKIEEAKKRFKQLYGYTEYQANELEKEIIEAICKSFNPGEEKITLRPQKIREEITETTWPDKLLSSHQRDIRIGFVIKKFNLSSEKKSTSKGISYVLEKEKVSKIRNLYCPTDNTPYSPSLPESISKEA